MPNVTFIERELEDYLCANDGEALYEHFDLKFIARQVKTEVGIVDILAYDPCSKVWVIIELKVADIDGKAYFQSHRYRHFYETMRLGARGERRFISLTIGNNLSSELFYSVNYYPQQQYGHRLVWQKDYYRIYDWKFDSGISFQYSNSIQSKIADGEYE